MKFQKKEYCLERVLRINPNNDNARRELEKLLSLGKSILESAVELPVHEEKQVRCFDDEKLRKISSSEIWEVTCEVDKLLSYLDFDVSRPQKDLAIGRLSIYLAIYFQVWKKMIFS